MEKQDNEEGKEEGGGGSLLFDGFYIIQKSEEDEELGKSPIRPISCKNFKTSSDREIFAAKNMYSVLKNL